VISIERLVRVIFKFEPKGSRGVYELPTKGEVVDVLHMRDLPSAVLLKVSSNRYCLCSFLSLFLPSSGKQEASITWTLILRELEELATQAQGGMSF